MPNELPDLLVATIEQIAERAAGVRVEQLESRIKFLEARLAAAERQLDVYTEKQVAELLQLSMNTLFNWRQGKKPVIPFVLFEGGGIRYRREDVERYLNCRKKAA